MFNDDVSPEFMHCFNVMNEIPKDEAMVVEEESHFDLYQESIHWNGIIGILRSLKIL
jgi:hypothetical protein